MLGFADLTQPTGLTLAQANDLAVGPPLKVGKAQYFVAGDGSLIRSSSPCRVVSGINPDDFKFADWPDRTITPPVLPPGAVVPGTGLNALSRAAEFGIQPYRDLRKLTQGTGLQAHHLIEKRFANTLGVNRNSMQSIALTRAEHQVFTNAWRQAIPYGQGTVNATRQQILNAARQIYRAYPEILRALGL